ncbi:hypothetical protein [Pendulispora albinea]|uniref:Knr4/Smi1-like domain-containing protein n=1 Tax=Pendulispora albinea TaxID=2741071 RepID=A0ABZ2M7N7_9BACT
MIPKREMTADAGIARAQDPDELEKPSSKIFRTSGAVARAVARLRARLADVEAATVEWRKRGWLAEGDVHGHTFEPPRANAGELLAGFESRFAPLPRALEALYGAMNSLWTGPVAAPGGERRLDRGEESFVFMPLERLLAHHARGRGDGIVLNHDLGHLYDLRDARDGQGSDDRSWTILHPADGAIYTQTKRDAMPRKMASSLVDYLNQLAMSFGKG